MGGLPPARCLPSLLFTCSPAKQPSARQSGFKTKAGCQADITAPTPGLRKTRGLRERAARLSARGRARPTRARTPRAGRARAASEASRRAAGARGSGALGRSARSRAAKREQSARFPQSWGRCCDVPDRQVGASLAPAGRTGRPGWPARASQARPAGRARLGPLWDPKWDRWTPNHEIVKQFWSKNVGHV